MWKHIAPLEGGGWRERMRSGATPLSCGEKGVIILSARITVIMYSHTHTHREVHTAANVYKHVRVKMLI